MQYNIGPTLVDQRIQATKEACNIVGVIRDKYITVSSGQEISYMTKHAQALSYRTAGYPADVTPYPWIEREALATSITPTAVADLIISTALNWDNVGSTIEAERRRAVEAIKIGDSQSIHQALTTLKNNLSNL